ncbi:MAG: RsmD family RNA methyltransferase, partial [Geminicoccaceae bacterium]|nr:RsmD family RNA methyltransferase [Geminicoccaceae bacterium]
FDIVFLDPPYGSGLVSPILEGLLDGWLGRDATVTVELRANEPTLVPAPFRIEDDRRYGAARFVVLGTAVA